MSRQRWAGIARMGGIGDNMIVSSVLPLLAEQYKVEVLTQQPCHVIFENNPFIDKLSVYEPGDLPTDAKSWQGFFALRAREYELFVNLSHSCEALTALFDNQTQFYWPAAFRRQLCGRSYLEVVHDIVGVRHEFAPRFFPTERELTKAQETRCFMGDRRIIAWVLSGSRIDKTYPYSTMVIARLIRELDATVMMVGSPREYEVAKSIMEHVEKQNSSLSRLHLALSPADKDSWPIRRSITQVQAADLVIGPDTGLMWSVASEAVPKIMMVSHASAANITKHWTNTVTLSPDKEQVPCHPCHLLHEDAGSCQREQKRHGMKPSEQAAACIMSIGVETIVQTAARLLQV